MVAYCSSFFMNGELLGVKRTFDLILVRKIQHFCFALTPDLSRGDALEIGV